MSPGGSHDASRGQVDSFGGHSATAATMEAEAVTTVAGEGLSPAEAEAVARDLATADLPVDVPDSTEGRSGGG